jgi:hypothetical protein
VKQISQRKSKEEKSKTAGKLRLPAAFFKIINGNVKMRTKKERKCQIEQSHRDYDIYVNGLTCENQDLPDPCR